MAQRVSRTEAEVARVRRVQELRRGSAASPVRNRKRYNRKADRRERAER